MGLRDGLIETGIRQEESFQRDGQITDNVESKWELNGGLGPAPREDPAAHAAIRDRVLHSYQDATHSAWPSVDYWHWDDPNPLIGPYGIDPLNGVTDLGGGGFDGSQQGCSGGDAILGSGTLRYYVTIGRCAYNVTEWFVEDYGFYWWRMSGGSPLTRWQAGSQPPYNDYPYGTTSANPLTGNPPILVGVRLKVYAPTPYGGPPGLACYMGQFGNAGLTWPAHFGGMTHVGSWTPGGAGSSITFTIDPGAFESSLHDVEGQKFANFCFPAQDIVGGNLIEVAPSSAEWNEGFGWHWDRDGYYSATELELDFLSPTFDAAKYASQYEVVTVNVCDSYFFGDSVNTG